MASTQAETGQVVPANVNELPAILRDECLDLAVVYRSPGTFLLACVGDEPVGCVGLRPSVEPDTAELKRLYVRPGHRRQGTGSALVKAALQHAARAGFRRVVLDVLGSRTHVIALYRGHGFEPIPPLYDSVFPMVWLGRAVPGPDAVG